MTDRRFIKSLERMGNHRKQSSGRLGIGNIGYTSGYRQEYKTLAERIETQIVTTKGDLLYNSDGSTVTRLAIGADNTVLRVATDVPAWETVASLFGDGDLADIGTKSHTSLTDIGTNTHAQVDTHIASTANPHSVTYIQAGLNILFKGEFNFVENVIDADPTGWTVSEPGTTAVSVAAEEDGHAKVIKMYDNDGSNSCTVDDGFAAQTSGTIEFYFKIDSQADSDKRMYIYVYEGANQRIGLVAYSSTIYNDPITTPTEICSFTADTWYHVRIVFDCASDDYEFYLNGAKQGTTWGFMSVATNLDKILFSSRSAGSSYSIYLDAIDYSWATGWYLNRNKEGYAYYTP